MREKERERGADRQTGYLDNFFVGRFSDRQTERRAIRVFSPQICFQDCTKRQWMLSWMKAWHMISESSVNGIEEDETMIHYLDRLPVGVKTP